VCLIDNIKSEKEGVVLERSTSEWSPWFPWEDPGLCHQRLDTKSAILGRFRTRDFWRILYAKISDIPFWRLFVRKLYLTLLATIVVRREVSNFKKSTFRPRK
jgi:hypothetical protein